MLSDTVVMQCCLATFGEHTTQPQSLGETPAETNRPLDYVTYK